MRHFILPLVLAYSLFTVQAVAEELTLARIDWCPYNCPDDKQPGFISEYLSWLFAKHNIHLNTPYLPWSRALKALELQQIEGIMTVASREVRDFVLPDTPLMYYQDCFFTAQNSHWKYHSLADIKNIQIGGIQDYLYGDDALSQYLLTSSNMLYVNGDNPDVRLINMLNSGRVDAYISDPVVHEWYMQNENITPTPKKSGCTKPIPLFIAFTSHSNLLEKQLDWLNLELQEPENIAYLEQLKAQYLGKLDQATSLEW